MGGVKRVLSEIGGDKKKKVCCCIAEVRLINVD